ncbi:ABC transporter ATP-binding protein [Hymenobacter weizhouensis]|uniref:ABC transporter ATP-binding protein n=1 Tax=Hymenobacter sp. YIM 151500-1 TaxID=2987689 RepID=UPI002226CEE0|nr:polysaccharide ABC transporter ATP-binding protein [Hymenobacter sp. YIM 151500-1]UYZ61374.1 polysaccharide ABC transporter ATP-binding protein [Hymenobacter sp. YIM 151500-1]
MSNIAIQVENLGKLYRLGEIGTGTLSHDLNRWWARLRGKEDPFAKIGETNDRTIKGQSDFVWSLKDVNFEVNQGEVLGIIGRNGAGKSTLLKILSKVTAPTTGRVKIKGRIASLLEVGTGFHPELTGRENIFLNGAILGMSKSEIRGKFDEIVDFSGVERYVDTPVKRYSSGMYVRLAFAVAAFLEPEILIVDEVLAVGDAEFQKKCLGRMKDVSVNDGRTVLFVSHNMAAVQNLCDSCVFLEFGTVKSIGRSDKIIRDYQGLLVNKKKWVGIDGDEFVQVTSTEVSTIEDGNIYNDQDININICISVKKDINDIVIGFNIISEFGYPIARASFNDHNNMIGLKAGDYILKFLIPKLSLATGSYYIQFDVAIPFIRKINSDSINLLIDVLPNGEYGNKYFVENSTEYNSIIRANWFNGINSI